PSPVCSLPSPPCSDTTGSFTRSGFLLSNWITLPRNSSPAWRSSTSEKMSSKPSEHDSAVISERKDRAVLCAKCEHLNAWGQNHCKRCGSRLYIACVDCGHKNERVRSRCNHCNRRL